MIGGVLVRPGDIIIADGDGVMSVERERVDFALEAAREREAKEKKTVERIRNGELTMDIYGWR
jgi:4-hydroxy-4-methyl-2-oxoglutarate aldolase